MIKIYHYNIIMTSIQVNKDTNPILIKKRGRPKNISLNIKISKPKGRKKKETYINERMVILNKIFEILGFVNGKGTIYLYDIDTNKKLQNDILALTEDVRKYFSCGGWRLFTVENVQRPYMCLIRCIFKSMNVKTTTLWLEIIREGKKIKTTSTSVI